MAELIDAADLNEMSAEQLLSRLIGIRQAMSKLKASDEAILDKLSDLHDAGEIDSSFTHDDWAFSYSTGRRKWDYPAAVTALEAQLKAARKLSEADGSAIATFGASFWTVREPRP